MSINVYTTPPYSSTSNGQVERFHSTLSEIMRCIKANSTGKMDTIRCILLLTTITTSLASIEILDYTNSYLVTINNGLAKIQDGTFRLIHIIDINKYEQLLTDIQDHITDKIPKDTFLRPILKHEINQTLEILDTLKPTKTSRIRKSINILGTAWKYLAGSPDHDDLEIINKNLLNLNQNNNKQVIINELFTNRINNISNVMNLISNSIRKDDSIINEIVIDLQSKIRLIKEELVNIKYAIQWAKTNVLNTLLLNKEEIKTALEKLREEQMPFNNAEEALEFSKINVLSKEMLIIYMIKIPLTNSEIFRRIIIRPVKKPKTLQ
ncbi:uncharacterized protein LOC126765866 [Bactrocera neohumeralis]|uniref:uncharacterized protein LOC126765866 n=1 Tax=Bactrocera neohumeralis TaxID=98809 RepID=UPI0021666EF5|nr:uncharacterized protein LOC126765866 [Bactrocera neohumeralis]